LSALKLAAVGPRRRAGAPPVEHSLLLTAALCLVAFGVVMVFSASSTTSLLGDAGDSAFYLKRTVIFGIAGLLVMRILAVRGVQIIHRLTPVILAVSIVLLVVVLIPGAGVEVNGARRWLGAGLFQVQPSEIAKLALVLHGASLLATRPKMTRSIGSMMPFLAPVAVVCLLVIVEPDLGTAMVACLTAAALLVAGGVPMRHLAVLGAVLGAVVAMAILVEPYRMARLTGFLDPGGDPGGAGFQAIQAKIALGSGGVFGVGLGESLQKAFYLPEAHTDMIAAVIGEELGLVGITVLAGLFGLFGYAGLRTAQRARDRYGKLLAAGLVSLIMVQAIINLFAVLGLAPLTGVPLPFVSYGNSSLLVLLAAVGLLLNVASGAVVPRARPEPATPKRRSSANARAPSRRAASGGGRLRVVEGDRAASGRAGAQRRSSSSRAKGRDSRGGNRRARSAGARRRRRASG
jgi:cell division protein FtsW